MDEVGFLNSILNDILTRKIKMDHIKKTYLDSPVA
jgi:hypothetical protein